MTKALLSLVVGLLILFVLLFTTDGGGASDFDLFLGRFHPALVHLPIGILLVALLLEVLTRSSRFASYSKAVADVESGASEGYSVFTHITVLYRDDPDLAPEIADWWDRYVEQFGMEPEYFTIEGYRNADLVARALDKAGPDLTHDGLIEAMESISDYTDMFGYRIQFGPNDHKGVGESVMSVVENGRWVTKAESVTY